MSQMSLFYRLNAYKNEYVVYYIIIICYIKSYLICMHGCVTGKEGRECEKRACAFELFHFSFLYKTNAFFHKLMHKYYITLKKNKTKTVFSASLRLVKSMIQIVLRVWRLTDVQKKGLSIPIHLSISFPPKTLELVRCGLLLWVSQHCHLHKCLSRPHVWYKRPGGSWEPLLLMPSFLVQITSPESLPYLRERELQPLFL